MPIGFVYWLIMLVWLILACMTYGPVWLSPVILFVLLALLGWKTFGFPIQG